MSKPVCSSLNLPLTKRGVGTVLAVCTALSMCASAHAVGLKHRVSVLDGLQEVPPVPTAAFGSARFVIDTCNNQLFYHISFTGLSSAETAAHIHGPAAPGVNAGVKHGLPLGNPKVGVWNYPQSDEADILGGRMYVNIHSVNFPGGEIRGQIVTHVAYLDGAQEVPANASAGRGFGLFNLDESANELSYYIAFGGLGSAETAAHFHGPARHGVNAGVMFGLPLGSPKVGVWAYTPAQEAAIRAGLTYVNIHSALIPGGEIRGQVVPFVAPMDGAQEVPPVATAGAGTGLFSLDLPNQVLGYDISFAGLSSAETAAHIHGFAPPGANAGVLHGLALGARKLGGWNYTPAQEMGILDSLTYVNVHTTVHPGGEIRGQIHFPSPACPADLDKDGVVGLGDLSILLSNFGTAGGPCDGDIDGSGTIDLADLSAMLAVFGSPCP